MKSNAYLKDFRAQIRSRFSEDSINMSMSEWISKNTRLRKRPFSYEGREFQRAIADDMSRNMYVIKCSQIGLALALDTPVPTPTGWTTMGGISVGDVLYDETGNPTKVTYVSPVYTDRPCYKITFDTGETIVADENHRWYVEAYRSFGPHTGRGRPFKNTPMFKKGVMNTGDIFDYYSRNPNRNLAIPNTQPLQNPKVDLPLDPYFLGLWLGDGNTHAAVITSHYVDYGHYHEELTSRGLVCSISNIKDDTVQFTVRYPNQKRPGRGEPYSVSHTLRLMGLLGQKKFIPDEYLLADEHSRRELLAGLIDTDGSVTKGGRVSFYNTNEDLIVGVQYLAHSLGFKTTTRWRDPQPNELVNGKLRIGEVQFTAYDHEGVTSLTRKLERLKSIDKGRIGQTRRRFITSVEKTQSVPVRCLTVDSPNHLFLAGLGMIPTHNTEIQIRKFAAFLARNVGVSGIFTLPDDIMYKRVSQTRIGPMINTDPVFNLNTGNDRPIRSMSLYQIGQSFGYVTGNKESDATSINADFLFHDELDLSDQEMIALFQSRLQGSDYRITQNFSTPTFEGFGIDAGYKSSDQHEYMARCTKCGHHNIPEYTPKFICLPGLTRDTDDFTELDDEDFARVDFSASYVRCEKCGSPLDLGNPELRSWVPRYPGRSIRGYRVSPFAIQNLDPQYVTEQMLAYKKKDAMRRFHNTVLGKPYNNSDARLSDADILAVMESGAKIPKPDAPVVIGIDVGITCHIVMMHLGHQYPVVFEWRQVLADNLVNEVKTIMSEYNVIGGCMDRHPYTPLANDIREVTNGLILPVEYANTPNAAAMQMVNDELDVMSHIRANRTTMIDNVASAIRKRRISFVGYGPLNHVILQHLKDMVRIEKEDTSATWQKLTGNDHFFHALAQVIFATRVHNAILFNSDADVRTQTGIGSLVISHQNEELLGMKSRRRQTISLGSFS